MVTPSELNSFFSTTKTAVANDFAGVFAGDRRSQRIILREHRTQGYIYERLPFAWVGEVENRLETFETPGTSISVDNHAGLVRRLKVEGVPKTVTRERLESATADFIIDGEIYSSEDDKGGMVARLAIDGVIEMEQTWEVFLEVDIGKQLARAPM